MATPHLTVTATDEHGNSLVPAGSGGVTNKPLSVLPAAFPQHGSANAAVTSVLAAPGAGLNNVVDGVVWSYSAAPTGGSIAISVAGQVIFSVDITLDGPGGIPFPRPFHAPENAELTVTLAAGGVGVTGWVEFVNARTESALAVFTPTQVAGYVDSPYNIALLRAQGKLWQDTAMTVPTIADGDPVRRIVCGTNYYDAPSDAARPLLWDEGNGRWSISFDGVDDVVRCNAQLLSSGSARFAALAAVATTRVGAVVNLGGSSSNGLALYWPSPTQLALSEVGVTGSTPGTVTTPSAWHRYAFSRSAVGSSAAAIYQDNTLIQGADYSTGTLAAGGIELAHLSSYPSEPYCAVRVAGLVALAGLPSVGERFNIDAYLADLQPPQLPLPERLTGYVDSPYNITLLRRHSKLYQNTSKTLQAVADGDPVRVVTCGGTDYVAPSDSARPLLWDEGNGKWSISFDGVDDYLRATFAYAWQPLTHAAYASVYLANTQSTYAVVASIENQTDSAAWRLLTRTAGVKWGTYGSPGDVNAGTTLQVGSRYVLGMDGGTFYLNGSSDGTYPDSFGVGGVGPPVGIIVGAEVSFNRYLNGRLSGLAVYTQPQPASVAALSSYLAALAPGTPPFPETLTGYVNSPYNIALLRLHGQLWQDTTFTTRATADGHPVRRIVCGSTYYDAPSDAARPLLYSEGGGKWSLNFDGVDDRLDCSSTDLAFTTGTMFAEVRPAAIANAQAIFGGRRNAMYACVYGDEWQLYLNTAQKGVVLTDGVWVSLIGVVRAANDADLVTNGSTITRTGGTGWPTRAGSSIGADPSGVQYFSGRIAGVGFATDTAPSTSQLNTYLTALTP